jgi:DNA-binding transcriptional ArsR family regulator
MWSADTNGFASTRIHRYRPTGVIAYRFSHDDLLRTRFAISPLMEISGAVEAVREPERFPIHAEFVAWARPRITGLDWDLLSAVVPRGGRWYPDFVIPPPAEAQPQLEGELRRVMETDPAQIAHEMRLAYPDGLPPAARLLIDRPGTGIRRLVDQMRAFWDAVLAPRWEDILALLESEIAQRGRNLATIGPAAAFADLGDGVAWRDGRVEVTSRTEHEVDLAGRGLLLVPAVFSWPIVWPINDPPWQPTIVYAPRGIAELWAPPALRDTSALDDLLGARRAAVLLGLDRPTATLDLARRLRASPAGVSSHLGVLRRAGLVIGRRDGRQVLYGRTRAGDRLIEASMR